MGFSDHLAQILWVCIDSRSIVNKKVLRRTFSKGNVIKFVGWLNDELWEEILVDKNVNELYQIFLNKFLNYFMRAFPLKSGMKREHMKNSWISSGIRISCQKMRLLNNVKYSTPLSRDSLNYIN
jgi:hypothetical protein